MAVEARIEIESFDPRDRRRRLAEQETLDDEVTVVGAEGPDPLETDRPKAADDAVRDDGRRIYRLVIDLPTATSYRGVQAASSRSARRPPRSIVPRPLPTPSLRVPRIEERNQTGNEALGSVDEDQLAMRSAPPAAGWS